MMKLPPLIVALGYAGLIPFLADPLWLTLSPQTAPLWLDHAWVIYAAMIASFMAGTFWGMGLQVADAPAGQLGMVLAITQMLLAWGTLALPAGGTLPALAGVFLLLLATEWWRERVFDPLGGYLRLRLGLTLGVLVALGWRWWLGRAGAA